MKLRNLLIAAMLAISLTACVAPAFAGNPVDDSPAMIQADAPAIVADAKVADSVPRIVDAADMADVSMPMPALEVPAPHGTEARRLRRCYPASMPHVDSGGS